MNNPTISVIVPVYNVENYLPRCIDSIITQTFTDFELLLIDDGSNDNSGKICDNYAEKDIRIRVFHKQNGGVSSARNLGLNNVRGKWISFIDADDCISKDFLSLGKTDGIDVIQKSYIVKGIDGKDYFHNIEDRIINSTDDIYNFFVQKRNNALWDKIISYNIIRDKRFREDISIGEDFLFFLSLLTDINSYKFSNIGKYIYYIRSDSAMRSINITYRITVLFNNIENIINLTHKQGIPNVGDCIIYLNYVKYLWSLREYLTDTQKMKFKSILLQLRLENLQYITTKQKALFLIRKYLLYKL